MSNKKLTPASFKLFLGFSIFLYFFIGSATGQSEKSVLGFNDYDAWKVISNEKISRNGEVIVYHEVPGKGNQVMNLVNNKGEVLLSHERAQSSSLSYDSRYLVFVIKPDLDAIWELRRRKTKKEDLPNDTLGIFDIARATLVKIPDVKSYFMPKEWDGHLVYSLEKISPTDTIQKSSTDSIKVVKPKPLNEKNGYHLISYRLQDSSKDTIEYVKSYAVSKTKASLIYNSSGKDSTTLEGVYYYNFDSKARRLLSTGEHQFNRLAIAEDGSQAAFLMDTSDVKSYDSDFQLRYWALPMDSAEAVVIKKDLSSEWIINSNHNLQFSEDGSKLYFYTSPKPIIKDTLLLSEELVQVEVWTHKDQRLYTQQNVEKEQDEKKAYLAVFHTNSKNYQQLGELEIPSVSMGSNPDQNHRYCFGSNSDHYMKEFSWDGFPLKKDIYLIDLETGIQKLVQSGVRGSGNISPGGHFLYWNNEADSSYYAFEISTGVTRNVTINIPSSILDELDDHPDFPGFYGLAGWGADDEFILFYDRYDIWKVSPSSPDKVERLTKGREKLDRHRMRKLDSERAYIDLSEDLIHIYNETTRDESYNKVTVNGNVKTLISLPSRLANLQKAKESDDFIFSYQTNTRFPDLIATKSDFTRHNRLSEVNSQQKNKKWSTVELIKWTSLDGIPLEGLLYKPEDFDAKKTYPLMVYFYEKNSHNIHKYWGAYPHRSIINPSIYASRGYIVFIPDIVYKDGYPGPSCYNAVIPGVTHLIDQGYIDIKRIGMQGHSWGGYQTAYLATRTDLFACAESGAPVSNMISAYGGIRWGSGWSRMFQYEHTQSRIGGSLWEYPLRYMENSPIFFADKINTPILIMHNDKDGAVPWYQGIELFVALRRLNKPVWLLNYNNEPHWPTKWENKVDFNIRMQQYFDHYLMGKEMPEWMDKGIPAIEKGYNKGY